MARARPSRKKRQESVRALVALPVLVILTVLIMNEVYNYYLLGGILLFGIILASIVENLVPDMRRKENKNKNSYTGIERKQKNSTQNKRVSTTTKSVKKPTSKSVREMKTLLKIPYEQMNGREFELIVAEYFKQNYKNAEKTRESKDGGVDITYIDDEGFKVAVQVKHRMESGKDIKESELRDLVGSMRNHKCRRTHFVTTTSYTPDAMRYAGDVKMKTYSFVWVNGGLQKWREEELKKIRAIG